MEIRVFAVERAVELMGTGTPNKDVIAKAKEIEAYIVGDAQLPEVAESDISAARSFLSEIAGMIGQGCAGGPFPEALPKETEIEPEHEPEEQPGNEAEPKEEPEDNAEQKADPEEKHVE